MGFFCQKQLILISLKVLSVFENKQQKMTCITQSFQETKRFTCLIKYFRPFRLSGSLNEMTDARTVLGKNGHIEINAPQFDLMMIFNDLLLCFLCHDLLLFFPFDHLPISLKSAAAAVVSRPRQKKIRLNEGHSRASKQQQISLS